MSDRELDVTGVGNAIVDVLAQSNDAFLDEHGLTKGTMALITEEQAGRLYDEMGPGMESSGGGAANTMAGVASLGGKPAYVGRVRNDQLGEIFRHDMTAAGIHCAVPVSTEGPATARCLILVTPDAQRTMNTYLGACVHLGPDDIDEDLIRRSKITYLEGYLWDRPDAKDAFVKAARIASSAGRKVALSLSDAFCVERHRESFLDLVSNHVDVLFANEAEITSLCETESFDDAIERVRGRTEIMALTRGVAGSVIFGDGQVVEVEAAPVDHVVDTTGAGDLYAAGVLFGLTRGMSLAEAGHHGSIAAAEVISHYGARPETRLSELATGG